jgi:hypothetical protein
LNTPNLVVMAMIINPLPIQLNWEFHCQSEPAPTSTPTTGYPLWPSVLDEPQLTELISGFPVVTQGKK